MTPPPLAGTSRLGLCPFVVKGQGEHYSVISRHGRRALATGSAGVEAIRLLAAGHCVQQTREVLGRRYGVPAGEIDLAPLLATLFASGFVRTVDGRPVAAARERGRHRVRAWLTLLVWSPLLEAALKYLPLPLARALAYRWIARAPHAALEGQIAASLRLAPALDQPPEQLARIAAGNRAALRKQFCDRLLLGSLPPRRARRWLGREIRVSGLEHLARAAARGKGTILCSFHMGSYGLIPFVLGARGMPVTMFTGFGEEARADVATWLAERTRRGDGYPVRLAGGVMGLRALIRCLAQGETALLYCDRAPGAAGGARHDPRGALAIPFLGTRIRSAGGLEWLYRHTGAAVLPAVLLWEGRGGHHLHIGAAIAGGEADGVAERGAVMVAAYGVLERMVQRHPAQWLRWESFAAMIAG